MNDADSKQLMWTFRQDDPIGEVAAAKHSRVIEDRVLTFAYLWARTVLCYDCYGLVLLSPTWRVSPDLGLRMRLDYRWRLMTFDVVPRAEMSPRTIGKGPRNSVMVTCPYCGFTTTEGFVQREAAADVVRPDGESGGRLGHVQYCQVKRRLYPVYRDGRPYKQGKSPLFFVIPPDILYRQVREREWVASTHGSPALLEAVQRLDPALAFLYGEDGGLAPGIFALGDAE